MADRTNRRRIATGRAVMLAILAAVLLAASLLDDYQGWRFLLLALAAFGWVCRRWAGALAAGLDLRRELRFGWAQVGDRLEERFTLENHAAFPALWVELQDFSTLPGYHASLASGIDPKTTTHWRSNGQCLQRGVFQLGPAVLRSADPFGLFRVEIELPGQAVLTVTPPVIPLPQIEVAAGGRAAQGRPRPGAVERTVSASGVRPYTPGDSPRWLHWRTTARMDSPYVRTFESMPSGDWWIVLDLDETCQAGTAPRSTEEHAVILAASLADRGLRLGRAVGLAASGQPLAWLPPHGGDTQRWAILRSLAGLHPDQRRLEDLLGALRHDLSASASLVIITARGDSAWLPALLPLQWKGCTPSLLLLDRQAFGAGESAIPLETELGQRGLRCYRITPDLLDRPEARPGRLGQWEWRITPTGRAIPVRSASENDWRRLAP